MPTAECGLDSAAALARLGPTLWVEIGFDPNFAAGADGRPDRAPSPLPALVDTGAVESCIDSDLAATLKLPIVDRQNMSGAHGASEVNMHLAQIYVPDLDHAVAGAFAGVHLTAGGQPHYALIGRNFLLHYTMIYEGGTGKVSLRRAS